MKRIKSDKLPELCLLRLGVVLGVLAPLLAAGASATQVRAFQSQGAEEFFAGELEGVSMDSLGRLRLAQSMRLLAEPDEPFVFTAAAHGDGWLLGTGSDGKVVRLTADGKSSVFFKAPEAQVFALWVDPDGTGFAGTSPGGKVYRIAADGSSHEEIFDPGETYIWALARGADGRLLVATGTRGRLYAVDGKGRGELVLDAGDVHLRTLLAAGDGSMLIGTAGEGRLLRLAADGKVRTLHDASQPEIVALAAGPDGSFYAAAVASEASLVDLSADKGSKSSASSGDSTKEAEGEDGEESESFEGTGSRPASFHGARTEILRIEPSGSVDSIHSLQDETVYSLLWHRDRLWVGTGQEGKLYSYRGDGLVLEKDCEQRQLVTLLPGAPGPVVVATNTAAVFLGTTASERRGAYTSRVLDAGAPARFGSFRWRGEAPGGSAVRFAFRSGLSATPDATWSDWSEPASGGEIPLGELAPGRYVQWRMEMEAAGGAAPRLDIVELSYRQRNERPRIQDFSVLDPGQILVAANFNPGQQVFEPAHPARDGIFTTLGFDGGRSESGRLKPLWKLGYRSLRWQAADPNQDGMRYALSFLSAEEAGEEAGGGPWLTMAEDLTDEHYSFDATVLPDGVYRFRLVASDGVSNLEGEALTAERISVPVVIDHSPPVVGNVERRGRSLAVRVSDAWNPIREAVASTDAGKWQPVAAADGLVDGRQETLLLELPDDARLLLLRLTDAAHNVVTVDLMRALP